ncbi:hypothetical protein THTE_2396 [Thermogutta terrifontis]|uniref:Uncharacterized protein n=1 Tax=Thermogutta terrifontis TaxID=1331910 RepID=A0A286RGB1_9BACT|nr:hypothetical protein THTE_2396 [Thermogutta terrifontis]
MLTVIGEWAGGMGDTASVLTTSFSRWLTNPRYTRHLIIERLL